jgi:uncharacterized protein
MLNIYEPEPVLDAFERREYKTILRMALPYAQAGNPDAQCTVALLYECGLGVEQDVLEAERWLLKATEQNSPLAWHNLGSLYFLQLPELEERWGEGRKCWERAKELGFEYAEPYPPWNPKSPD